MDDKKKLIKNFVGIAFTAGLSFATQGSSNIILGVLNIISSGIASNYIQKTEYDKIKKLIQETDPSELNHDIKKLIVKSIEWAIKNIEYLYKRQLNNKGEILELREFTQKLVSETKILKHLLEDKPDTIYEEIENTTDPDTIYNTFNLKVSDFPVINKTQPYSSFFQEQFKPNLQLCFGELLKLKENRPALIAYQRNIYKTIDSKLDDVITQNKEILSQLKETNEKKASDNYTNSLTRVKSYFSARTSDELSSEFKEQLDLQFQEIQQQYQQISKHTDLLIDIKGMTKGVLIELQKNWISKNKVYVLGGGFIFLVIISFFIYHNINLPFNAIVSIVENPNLSVNQQYPSLGKEQNAKIRFYFPSEIKLKEITFENGIVLPDIPRNLKEQKIKVELLDKYWTFSNDSMKLKKGTIQLDIEPNNSMAKITGSVFSHIGQIPIESAFVSVDDELKTETNVDGKFLINVPVHLRKPKYVIKIVALGFHSQKREYTPGNEIPVGLHK